MSEALQRTEARAVGVVTQHTSRWSHGQDHPSLLYFPSVRFQPADGRTLEFRNKIGTNAPPRVGDEVTLYDPSGPEEAEVALGRCSGSTRRLCSWQAGSSSRRWPSSSCSSRR